MKINSLFTNLSIRAKISSVMSFLIVLTVAVLSFITIDFFEKQTRDIISKEQNALTAALADEIDDKMRNTHSVIIRMSEYVPPSIISDAKKADEFLDRNVVLHSLFDNGIFLFDSKGVMVAESPIVTGRVGESFVFREYMQTTLKTQKPHIGDVYRSSQPHRHPAVMFTAPVLDAKGAMVGVLAGSVDLLKDNFLGSLVDMKIGRGGYLYIIGQDRTMIVHKDRTRILSQDVAPGQNLLLDRALAGFEGTDETVTSRGLHVFTSFTRLKTKNWLISANFPVTEAFALMYQARDAIVLTAVGLVLLSLFAMHALVKAFTKPLFSFAEHVAALPDKTGQERLFRKATGNEIGVVTSAFNGMVLELDRRKDLIDAQREELAVALRAIDDGVVVTDREGRILLMNPTAERITGIPRDEGMGRMAEDLLSFIADPRSVAAFPNPVAEARSRAAVVHLPLSAVLRSGDGAEHPVAGSCAPILDARSEIRGTVLVIRDISERRRLEAQLAKSDKLEAVALLAGGIAHDYNNLLTAILGNLSMARTLVDEKTEVHQLLERVERASLNARDLTRQLLTFSKGGQPLKRTSILPDLVQNTVLFALRGSSVRPEFSFPDNLGLVDVDRGQIGQVMHNLAINAAQAMPGGGVIRISAENRTLAPDNPHQLPPGPYISMTVRDTGPGIPEENLLKIFDPYFTTKKEGSGLGLATSYAIMKNHGGILTAASVPGEGSTFELYFPASSAEKAEFENPESFVARGSGRILVMDDDVLVSETLQQILTSLGYSVTLAADGQSAIEEYRKAFSEGNRFDLVIMDLTIPGGMGGREAIQHLRAFDPAIRAIVSSGYSTAPVMANYREYGFQGVIAKPYRVADLSAELKRVLHPG